MDRRLPVRILIFAATTPAAESPGLGAGAVVVTFPTKLLAGNLGASGVDGSAEHESVVNKTVMDKSVVDTKEQARR